MAEPLEIEWAAKGVKTECFSMFRYIYLSFRVQNAAAESLNLPHYSWMIQPGSYESIFELTNYKEQNSLANM